jgi:catechol 2,3-dioxygenase-like lactoylglutathione lyase family enzyme
MAAAGRTVRSVTRLRWNAVCIDCRDAETLADFYRDLLEWQVVAQDGHGWFKISGGYQTMAINIQAEPWYEPPQWPERAGGKDKMLHFEIEVDDVETAVSHALDAGATLAKPQPANRDPAKLRVLLDPAGHPFCLWSP